MVWNWRLDGFFDIKDNEDNWMKGWKDQTGLLSPAKSSRDRPRALTLVSRDDFSAMAMDD